MNNQLKHYLIAAVLVLGLTSPSIAAQLSGDQIRAEFAGKTFSFKTKKGLTGKVRYSKTGKSKMSKTNFDIKKDSGKWRIKGNKICATWKVIRKGKEKCFSISKTGSGKFVDSSGTAITFN